MSETNKKPHLKVIEGGRDKLVHVNRVTLKVVSDNRAPLPVDVRIFEEDTFLVLTVDPVMRYTEEHPIRLMTKVAQTKPNKPGSIVTNNASWYAIVHDVDSDPTWRVEWIEKAYRQALVLCEIHRVRRIGFPLLGTVHGKYPPEKSLTLLIDILRSSPSEYLKHVLILVPKAQQGTTWKDLLTLTGKTF